MVEEIVRGRTLPQAYHMALLFLHTYGTMEDCQDWNTRQLELSMTIFVEEPLAEPMISRAFIGSPLELEQYRQEMLDGILDFEIRKGNWKYTYHDRMVNYPYFFEFDLKYEKDHINQIDFVINELKRNPSSRRAVILIRDNSIDPFNDDPACLQHLQYFIRDNELHCKALFRSNDACKATFMNMFALIMLQKKIADELGIPVGTYVHRANSFHCYEKDLHLLEGYVARILRETEEMTYDYEGDWKEMMDEFKPTIEKKVKILKER